MSEQDAWAELINTRTYWSNEEGVSRNSGFFGFIGLQHFTVFQQFYESGTFDLNVLPGFPAGQRGKIITDDAATNPLIQDPQFFFFPTVQQDIHDLALTYGRTLSMCDTSGRLYTRGGNSFRQPNPPINGLGHGLDDDSITSGQSGMRRSLRTNATRVVGENAELHEVRFIKCGSSYDLGPTGNSSVGFGFPITSGLAADGALYIAGSNYRGMLGDGQYVGQAHADIAGISRSYHKPLLGYSFKTYSHGHATMLAIDQNDHLYEWGGTTGIANFRQDATSQGYYSEPYKYDNGFVDTVAITDPGDPPFTSLTVSVSPPERPGRTATVLLQQSSGFITAFRLRDPGFGYDNPPTITFSVGGGKTPPTAVATLFSSSWSSVYSSPEMLTVAPVRHAISSDGNLYAWGAYAGFGTQAIRSPRRLTTSDGDKHFVKSAFTTSAAGTNFSNYIFALTDNGQMYAWSGVSSQPLQPIAGGPFVDFACVGGSVLAIRDDGVLFGLGKNSEGQLATGDVTQKTVFTQAAGNFRAKRVYGMPHGESVRFGTFVLLRDMTYDAAGNPIYAT